MKRICITGLTTLLFVTTLHAQIITTIIGNGSSTSTGDGGVAVNATCWDPKSVTVDQNGNVYFTALQTDDDRVRKITAATNIVNTVAGTGVEGFSGDGGPSSLAMLNDPRSVDVDAAGNVYIADESNNRIRKIDVTTGYISTIAGTGVAASNGDGGPALSAAVRPFSIAVDNAGNVFFHDYLANSIRKIDAATNTISRVVGDGTGVAGFSGDGGPATLAKISLGFAGICVNRNTDDIFMIDVGNTSRIRKVTAATGIITTIAGNGSNGLSGDGGDPLNAQFDMSFGGLRLDAANNLFIADWGNNCIRKIDFSQNKVFRVAGTGLQSSTGDGGDPLLATFEGPQGLAFDPSGNLLIADENANRIRKITFSATSVEDIPENFEAKLYPNPNNGSFMLEFKDDATRDIEITDATGRLLVSEHSVGRQKNFHFNDAADGIYFLHIKQNGQSKTLKFSLMK